MCVGSEQKEDYYNTLGVPRNASQKEIKKAYYEVCQGMMRERREGGREGEKGVL